MAALLAPASATAATITVNSAEDDSAIECTLRDAIEAAKLNAVVDTCAAGQAAPALDTIRFALPSEAKEIRLQTALPTLGGPLRVEGPGAAELAVSGSELVRVFEVPPGQTVSVTGLKLKEGLCEGNCEGGGVLNYGNLTLEAVVVEQNYARAGGLGNNFPTGGGIFNGGQLSLISSSVLQNRAVATSGELQNAPLGGGIRNVGTLILDSSIVAQNAASAEAAPTGTSNAVGGGIANAGDLTILRSSIVGNTARGEGSATSNAGLGGGIQSVNPALPTTIDVAIEGSTISNNEASAGEPGQGRGGGIAIPNAASFRLIGSTVAGNGAGVGANIEASSQATTVRSTIVAEPSGGSSCAAALPSSGFNLDDGTGCGFTAPTDLSSADPMLGALADNGGPTETMALEEGSPAVDRGLAGAGEATDQRGLPRRSDFPGIANAVGGDGADIGAVELQGGLLPGESPPAGPPAPLAPVADLTAPKLKLGKGPGKVTFDRTPTFRFGSEPGARFGCKVDKGRFIACRSPFTTKRLSFGKHRVKLRATDAAGNVSAVAVRGFEVLRPRR